MILKVTFVITIITMCFGAAPRYPQTDSNQATYSQSFVRKDVPISYQYRAIHDYTSKKQEDSPKGHEDTQKWHENSPNTYLVRNHQFGLLPFNSRENTYPATPVLYTSIVSDPAYRNEQLKQNENPAKSANQTAKQANIQSKEQNIGVTTYRPHLNHDIKMYHNDENHSRLWPKFNEISTPKYDMAGVHQLAVYHKHQRLLEQQPYHITATTAKNPKISNRLNLGVKNFPKQENPFVAISQRLNENEYFQPIPRLAYNNKFNTGSVNLGVLQSPTRKNPIHLNTFHSGVLDAIQFKPNVLIKH